MPSMKKSRRRRTMKKLGGGEKRHGEYCKKSEECMKGNVCSKDNVCVPSVNRKTPNAQTISFGPIDSVTPKKSVLRRVMKNLTFRRR